MYILEGKLVPKKIRVGIVASRFNEFITSRLLSGALDCLRRHEVPEDDITVAWVPGAFEIPLIASRMAASRRYDAVICLGAVIPQPLRLCVQRGLQGHCPDLPCRQNPGHVRRADHGEH